MNVLISPTAFKGTLSPHEASRTLHTVIKKRFPRARIRSLPLADGGDGTLDVLMTSMKGRLVSTRVNGPQGKRVTAHWALCAGKIAVIEMARASGLALVMGRNDTRAATSYGTGELIKAALNKGCRTILIGVGGTATSDGGAGALRALGLKYFDKAGRLLDGPPNQMIQLNRVDWSGLDPRLKKTSISVICDVTNPLLGKNGSAHTFGPQKGASPRDVLFIERVMKKWSTFARFQTRRKAGAGAAGALAFGLSGFLNARLVRGTPFIMERLAWRKAAQNADVIVTGEGRLDKTSFSGKVIGEITRHAAWRGRTKVFAVCGDSPLGTVYLGHHGIAHIERLGPAGLRRPAPSLRRAAERLCAYLSSSSHAAAI